MLPHPAVGLPLNDLPFATPDLGLAISAGTAGGLGFAQFLDGAGYHTMRDAPDAVESGSLQDHGDNALALTRHSGA